MKPKTKIRIQRHIKSLAEEMFRAAERANLERALDEMIAQGLAVQLPNGNVALTAKGMEIADAQAEGRRSTKQ